MVSTHNIHNFLNYFILASSLVFSASLFAFNAEYGSSDYETALQACQSNQAYYNSQGYSTSCDEYASDTQIGFVLNFASSSTSYLYYCSTSNPICVAPVQCPSGQTDIGNGCEDICVAGNESTITFEYKPGNLPPLTYVDSAGCSLTLSSSDFSKTCKLNSAADGLLCSPTYISNGSYTDPDTFDYSNQTPESDDVGTSIPPTQSTETNQSNQSTDAITNGTATTTTDTTIQTNDMGTTIETIGNTVVKKNSSGEIVEIVKQTVFNEFNDGTAQEIVTTTTTANKATINQTTYDIQNQSVTNNTYQSGSTGSVTKTVTTTYNNLGQSTGQTVSQSGSISGDSTVNVPGQESIELPSFCEYASSVCEFMAWVKGEGYTPPEHPDLPIEEIDVSTFESDWTSGLGVGTCPASISMSGVTPGTSYEIDFIDICWTAETVIKPFVLILAAISAAFIIAGFRENQ